MSLMGGMQISVTIANIPSYYRILVTLLPSLCTSNETVDEKIALEFVHFMQTHFHSRVKELFMRRIAFVRVNGMEIMHTIKISRFFHSRIRSMCSRVIFITIYVDCHLISISLLAQSLYKGDKMSNKFMKMQLCTNSNTASLRDKAKKKHLFQFILSLSGSVSRVHYLVFNVRFIYHLHWLVNW